MLQPEFEVVIVRSFWTSNLFQKRLTTSINTMARNGWHPEFISYSGAILAPHKALIVFKKSKQ